MTLTTRAKFLLIGGTVAFILTTAALWAYFAFTEYESITADSNLSNQVVAVPNNTEYSTASEFNFSEIQNEKTLFARRLAIFDLVDKADEKTLGQLFDQTTQMPPGSFRREVETAIVRKWATVSPQNVLTHIEGIVMLRYRDLLPLVFEEWSLSDLDKAISYATRFGPGTRQIVFDSIQNSVPDWDLSEVMTIATKLNVEFYATQKIFKELAESEIDDPMVAWTQFVKENKNRFRKVNQSKRSYLLAIAKALGDLGVEALYAARASLSNVNDRMTVIPTIVHHVAKHDPQAALEFALTEERDLTGMTWGVVWVWADSDPIAALTAVTAIEDFSRRDRLQRAVLDRWSEKDPISMLQNTGDFPESVRQLAEEKARVAMAERSPEQASGWLQEIEDLNVRAQIATQIARSWAKHDATAVLEWIQSDRTLESMKDSLVRDVVREVTRTNPQLALDTALEYSVPDDSIGPEAEVISVIARYDPDTAIKILSVARNEATKFAGLLSIGSQLLGRTHDSQERAIELAEQLNSDEAKHRYLSSLMYRWDYEDLYSRIDQFPTSELKEQAANQILDNDKQNLSSAQIKKLQSFLTESD